MTSDNDLPMNKTIPHLPPLMLTNSEKTFSFDKQTGRMRNCSKKQEPLPLKNPNRWILEDQEDYVLEKKWMCPYHVV